MVGFAASNQQPTVYAKFLSAGFAACIADMCTFPLDTAKVRLQLQGEGSESKPKLTKKMEGSGANCSWRQYRGMFGTIMTISRQEGPRALYNGLCAGLQRQMAFASVRIGLYDVVKLRYVQIFGGGKKMENSVLLRIIAGVTTGGMAVVVAQPTDVVKVRMQGQHGPVKRYVGVTDAFRKIATREGVRGLWKGTIPNVTRNAVVNASELVCYDLIKEFILKKQLLSDNMPCHFVSAFGAGFCTTVIASPVDVVKTRFMNSSPGQYRGAYDCAVKMFTEGGPAAFYKGFMPSFIRLGSWNIAMFVCFEQLKRAAINYGAVQPPKTQLIL